MYLLLLKDYNNYPICCVWNLHFFPNVPTSIILPAYPRTWPLSRSLRHPIHKSRSAQKNNVQETFSCVSNNEFPHPRKWDKFPYSPVFRRNSSEGSCYTPMSNWDQIRHSSGMPEDNPVHIDNKERDCIQIWSGERATQ